MKPPTPPPDELQIYAQRMDLLGCDWREVPDQTALLRINDDRYEVTFPGAETSITLARLEDPSVIACGPYFIGFKEFSPMEQYQVCYWFEM